MILTNSSSLMTPSPSLSASSIISWISSSFMFSPSSLATLLRFLNEMAPLSSSSKSLNALIISSLGSLSAILIVIRSKNWPNSITPLPSASNSEIILLMSSFLGSKPRALMATLSSFESIVPDPSVSNRSKASLISCLCSSVSSVLFFGLVTPDFLNPDILKLPSFLNLNIIVCNLIYA